MDTTDFVRRVTGTAGYYCILALGPGGSKKQKFYRTAAAAVSAAENFDDNGYNVYFALGRFADDEARTVANVAQMRAFYLDLDCGPKKDYPDQSTALQALRGFVKKVKLPKPIVVNSGRGIHAYWPLSAPVSLAEWQPVALRFKRACAALGMRSDTNVTADAARVLRVPGTRNYKDTPPNPVAVLGAGEHSEVDLQFFDACVSAHAPNTSEVGGGLFADPSATVNIPKDMPRERSGVMDVLMGGIEASFKKIAKRSAAGTGCGQFAFMLRSPEEVPEPLWRAGLSVATRCVEKKAVHWLSAGHPEYDPEDTEYKAGRTKGPYLCTKFDDASPGICADCPHFGKIKSPIVLGHVLAAADPDQPAVQPAEPAARAPKPSAAYSAYGTIPPYPAPYVRGKAGGVFLPPSDDEDDVGPRMIWNNDLYVVRRLVDPEQGEVIEMRHHLPRDGIRSFVVPLYNVTSKEEFRKVLATNGVMAINKEVDALMSYTQAWVRELQYRAQADDAHRQYGWVGDFDAFVAGDKVVFADRVEHNAPTASTRSTIDCFEPKGTLEGWKDAVNFYNRPGFELHQLIVCAGFGSALMKFMPVNAALIHLWSKDSGFGKTTVQHAALSIWGDPEKLILKERDTHNSRMLRADVMHSLPVCMDEITNISPKDGSDMIYQITGGTQRNRMSSNGNTERYRGDPWNLLFVSSANCSLIDKVAMGKAMPKAEAQRVLEVEVSKLFNLTEDKEQTDAFSRALLANYGHAGELFVQYVMAHRQEVQLLVETIQKQIDTAAALGPQNRFWSAAVATSIAAAAICNHRLGLLQYDVSKLTKYVITRVLKANQAATAEMAIDAVELASSYAYHNWGRILQIKSSVDLRGRVHGNGIDTLVVPEQLPRATDLVGRYETDVKRLYILIRPFKEWLSEQQVNYQSVFEDLSRRIGARKVRMRLSKGTHMILPPTDVLELPMAVEVPGDGEET